MNESPTERLTMHEDAPQTETFDEAYFMDGVKQKKSNFENYHWMPEQTLAYAIYVQRHLGIQGDHTLLDVGCARGFFVKAMRMMGIKAFGHDISKWAIANCDPEVREFVSNELKAEPMSYDWITLKDVCEHIPMEELVELIGVLSRAARRGMLVVVPLSAYHNGRYIREEDEQDITHIHRWTLVDWIMFFMQHTQDFTVNGAYYIKGVKESCKGFPMSAGFFTLTRI